MIRQNLLLCEHWILRNQVFPHLEEANRCFLRSPEVRQVSYPAKNLVSNPQPLLRLLTATTPKAARAASATTPIHGATNPSLSTGTAMPPMG